MAAISAYQQLETSGLAADPMLIVTGSAAGGVKYIGPFSTHEEAAEYARDNVRDSWWLYPLSRPQVS